MTNEEYLQEIRDFSTHYQYDNTFEEELLEHSAEGYKKFADFKPMAGHLEKLDMASFWIVKLAAMQVEDCGHCLQLNVRMALEYGVSKELVESALNGGSGLPEELFELHQFAVSVAAQKNPEDELMESIQKRFDKGALLEIGLAIASAKVFPTIKRALGYTRSCSLITVEV